MHPANPFAGHELHSPQLTAEEATRIARERFGVEPVAPPTLLGSHQDQNFLLDDGTRQTVLKIANTVFTEAELEMQNAAMLHLAARGPFDVQVPIAAADGSLTVREAGFQIRHVTFLDGFSMEGLAYLAPPVLDALGRLAGGAVAGLADFDHPAADRLIQWDLRQAHHVVDALAPLVADPDRRALAERAMASASAVLERLDPALRRQVIHADVTPFNVIARRDRAGRPVPTGLIDFGDMVRSWVAAEPAILAASLPEPSLAAMARIVGAFHAVVPLTEDEIAALHALVVARGASVAVSTDQQASLEPDNAYAQSVLLADWHVLESVAHMPAPVAHAAFRLACGLPARPTAVAVPRGVDVVDGIGGAPSVDLGITTLELEYGAWEDPSAVAAAVRAHGPLALGRYGEGRIVHADRQAVTPPPSVHLGVDVFAAIGTPVHAPLAGVVRSSAERELLLDADGWLVRLAGIHPHATGRVEAGETVGAVAAADGILPPHVHVQITPDELDELPGLATPEEAAAWLAVCPDPAPLLGVAAGATRVDAAAAYAARDAHVAHVQETYYEAPPVIERGYRQHLYDTDGRAYLDVVNNVAVLGHAHPGVAAAVARQSRLLNTNSRFLYRSMTRFASRLAELTPPGLDRVFLVSTGSEANDLALRIARVATQQRGVLCVRGAYHGWTQATLEISTSLVDNPGGVAAVPDWVHPVTSPNPYRGDYGSDTARYVADVEAALTALRAAGRGVAAFLAEPLYGNAGGVALPDGYLQAVYPLVRAAGGVCIADEVQVGYGRLGSWFWAFEQQGVVPDAITIAKATGNGHPVAAVITTAELAEAFERDASFFASVGGSPVSCEAGLAVLDAMAAEGLQENARIVGERFKRRLEELVERFGLVGAAHGYGLYCGLELVRDRATKEPATEEASAICERLRELGIIVQPTGDHLNVLKLKPPLVFEERDADRVANALERVLHDGW